MHEVRENHRRQSEHEVIVEYHGFSLPYMAEKFIFGTITIPLLWIAFMLTSVWKLAQNSNHMVMAKAIKEVEKQLIRPYEWYRERYPEVQMGRINAEKFERDVYR